MFTCFSLIYSEKTFFQRTLEKLIHCSASFVLMNILSASHRCFRFRVSQQNTNLVFTCTHDEKYETVTDILNNTNVKSVSGGSKMTVRWERLVVFEASPLDLSFNQASLTSGIFQLSSGEVIWYWLHKAGWVNFRRSVPHLWIRNRNKSGMKIQLSKITVEFSQLTKQIRDCTSSNFTVYLVKGIYFRKYRSRIEIQLCQSKLAIWCPCMPQGLVKSRSVLRSD